MTDMTTVPASPIQGSVESPLSADIDRLRALQSFNAHLMCMAVDQTSYDTVVQGVAKIIGCEVCALFLHDDAAGTLVLKSQMGRDLEPGCLVLSVEDSSTPYAQAFCEEYLVHLEDLSYMPLADGLSDDLKSCVLVPVISNKGPVGVFHFGSHEIDGFPPEDVTLCSMLVDQMAYSLENIRLVGELSNSRDAVIRGMALLAEMRDDHIGGHLSRIAAMSRYLARQLMEQPGYYEVTERFIDDLSRAAVLHDVGKVGIPDAILMKPGKFTPAEFEVMKTHSRTGADMMQGLIEDFGQNDVLGMGVAVALHHHERWDGAGYPDGLAGTDIPLAARIVAICDVYDALCSKRIYKEAWTHEEAIEALIAGSGSQFDPTLLDAFLKHPEQLLAIQKRFPDELLK